MLKLYFFKPVNDPDVYYIDDYFNFAKDKTWFNSLAIRLIEEIDGNKHIGDGVSESPTLGVLSPGELSGGIKTLILSMNRPESICPLKWLGDNLSDILVDISNSYDISFNCVSSYFKFSPKQVMMFPEFGNEIVTGDNGFREFIDKHDLYEAIHRPFPRDFSEAIKRGTGRI